MGRGDADDDDDDDVEVGDDMERGAERAAADGTCRHDGVVVVVERGAMNATDDEAAIAARRVTRRYFAMVGDR